MGIESQHQRGAFLDQTDASVLVAMNTALMPFGLFEPALQVEIVRRPLRLFAPDKQPGRKARHDTAHMLPHRVIAVLQLLPQDLKTFLTLVARAAARIEGGVDHSHLHSLLTYVFLGGLHAAQPPVDVAGQPRQSLMSRPPFCASRFRWSDARTSSRASAIRRPGGCSGPP